MMLWASLLGLSLCLRTAAESCLAAAEAAIARAPERKQSFGPRVGKVLGLRAIWAYRSFGAFWGCRELAALGLKG